MCASQAALSSLEREAKENVYAVLDPHIQYEITINNNGEPPKYLSLSKPLTHQRTHAFDPQSIASNNEINNNNFIDNRFSTFKTGPPKTRISNRNKEKINLYEQNYICKSNKDIEYSRDPFFGLVRNSENKDTLDVQNIINNSKRISKNHPQMYEGNNSDKKDTLRKKNQNWLEKDFIEVDAKRASNRSSRLADKKPLKEKEKERSFEEYKEDNTESRNQVNDYKPRPGKVKEIASKFNRHSAGNFAQLSYSNKMERPKPLQSYGYQAYLDHVFPDAVEI